MRVWIGQAILLGNLLSSAMAQQETTASPNTTSYHNGSTATDSESQTATYTGSILLTSAATGQPIADTTGVSSSTAAATGQPITDTTAASSSTETATVQPITGTIAVNSSTAAVTGQPITATNGVSRSTTAETGQSITDTTVVNRSTTAVMGHLITATTGVSSSTAAATGQPITDTTAASSSTETATVQPITGTIAVNSSTAAVTGQPITATNGVSSSTTAATGQLITYTTGVSSSTGVATGQPITDTIAVNSSTAATTAQPVTNTVAVNSSTAAATGQLITATSGVSSSTTAATGQPITATNGVSRSTTAETGQSITDTTVVNRSTTAVMGHLITATTGVSSSTAAATRQPITDTTAVNSSTAVATGQLITATTGTNSSTTAATTQPITDATVLSHSTSAAAMQPVAATTGASSTTAAVTGQPITATTGSSSSPTTTTASPVQSATTLFTQSTSTTESTTSVAQAGVEAYSGKTSFLLKFGNESQPQDFASFTRTYAVLVSGGNSPLTVNIGDVKFHLVTGLESDMTYTVDVSVYNDNTVVASASLVVTTTTACTLTCKNSECIVMEDDAQTCYCLDGYDKSEAGSNVCNDIDECRVLSQPCSPYAVCANTIGSHNCYCVDGFENIGGGCEEFSICSRSPCLNNGTCIPYGSQFSCDCPPYYHGHRCQDYVTPCTQSPCQNGGTCVDESGGYSCSCPSAFKGLNCTEDVDECAERSFTCLENSHCFNDFGDYKCMCDEGYRGDGKAKCYEIILLPYGESESDSVLPAFDDVASPTISMPFGLQIGERTFTSMNVISNGFIYLGPLQWPLAYLLRPRGSGWSFNNVAMIAPFWDDFHPTESNGGRVYYQVYDQVYSSLKNKSVEVVQEVAKRIRSFSNKTDFEPLFVLKATWSNVLMYYDKWNRGYPSTFQAIIATDLSDTFIIYYYKEDGMLFDVKKRFSGSNRALIGYTNGAELKYVEVQENYRPDQRVPNADGKKGQYFYHVTKDLTKAEVLAARASCAAWYRREVTDNWSHDDEPCPCTQLQAIIDDRFTTSVDWWLWRYSKYEERYPGLFRSADITEWKYDEAPRGNCYQFRIGNSNSLTPRCCYGSRQSTWSWWWGWWSWGPLLEGPFGSRYERHQIPIVERNPSWSWVSLRNVDTFERQYNESLEYDLIPRRQCCVQSKSSEYCKLYKELRPAATCEGYVRRWPAFFFGDPHITTSDGVLYSFNGLGEYHMVYAPGIFALQARTQKAVKDDGTPSDATVFVAFAAQDLAAIVSGTVQFEVDFNKTNGDGVIVKIDGEAVNNISEMVTTVKEVTLTMANGTYKAIFPSSQSLSVSASNFLLSIQFTGDTQTMLNMTKGLLGKWDGVKENDFEMRNGTVVDWSSLHPIDNLNILNGTLSEKKLYPFGQSWQISESESIFNYTGGSDTYQQHNPSSASKPPFLEDLVAAQRDTSLFNEILSNCTTNGVISTTCLYDVLTTNRSDIGANTLSDADSSATVSFSNAITPPNITLQLDINTSEDGNFVLAKVNQTSTYTFQTDDPDNDNVTFQLDAQNVVPGMSIDQSTGIVTWTPNASNITNSDTNWTLTVIATDSVGAESILTVSIKLCPCQNNGSCLYNVTLVGGDNFEIVGCECMEAYAGDYCEEDRNGCELSACFANVTCTDVRAPGVGETCGDCPPGTTGDGRNCTNIDMCLSNPCQQECETLYNGFECSCFVGYNLINLTHCSDIDECMASSPCTSLQNTVCVNTDGSYRCDCASGFVDMDGVCVDVDECSNDHHQCMSESSECLNYPGSYSCPCLGNFTRQSGESDQSPCTDLDECTEILHNCNNFTQNCVNLSPFYRCDCKSGFERQNGSCLDIKECNNPTLNNCNYTRSDCVEQEGDYECECLTGYVKISDHCENINECLGASICSNGTICVNTDGGYTCVPEETTASPNPTSYHASPAATASEPLTETLTESSSSTTAATKPSVTNVISTSSSPITTTVIPVQSATASFAQLTSTTATTTSAAQGMQLPLLTYLMLPIVAAILQLH